jgi:septum formation protein
MNMDGFDQQIILASASPRRQEILQILGLAFSIHPSEISEALEDGWKGNPQFMVETLAERKATDIASKVTQGLVIGSDTVVVVDQTILGKPGSEEEAFRMLSDLQGRTHSVFSGLAIIDAHTGDKRVGFTETIVKMRPVSPKEIREYIATGEPMDKAGSYAIQGIGSIFIEQIRGEYYSVVGMPVGLLVQYLSDFGISVLQANLRKSSL